MRVTTSNNIEVATIEHTYRMIVSRLIKFSDLCPFIFGYFIDFALFSSLIRVFGTYCKQKVLGSVLESFVKMSYLMT